MTPVMRHEWTYEDCLALPEEGLFRYEVFEGERMMIPSPNTRPQEISWSPSLAFGSWLKKNQAGRSFSDPYVSKERFSTLTAQNIQGVPELNVEILSPATEKRDPKERFSLYERFRVPEYGIVAPETDTPQIFRWTERVSVSCGELRGEALLESPALPGLSIPVQEIFSL